MKKNDSHNLDLYIFWISHVSYIYDKDSSKSVYHATADAMFWRGCLANLGLPNVNDIPLGLRNVNGFVLKHSLDRFR